MYPSWFGFPVISVACFSLLHVSGMIGDPNHDLLVAVFYICLHYILWICFYIYILYPPNDSDSQSSLSHVSLARMCPTWLGIRCMTYIVGCFYICYALCTLTVLFISILYPAVLMIRTPSHLWRMFLFVRMCPAWLGVRIMSHWRLFLHLYIFDCAFISILLYPS